MTLDRRARGIACPAGAPNRRARRFAPGVGLRRHRPTRELDRLPRIYW